MTRSAMFLGWLGVLTSGVADAADVTLIEAPDTVTLANAHVSARIDKQTGQVRSLQSRGVELLGRGGGYWSFVGGRASGFGTRRTYSVRTDPATNHGDRAEVAILREGGDAPIAVDFRYALGRDDHGLYCYALWRHGPSDPAMRIGEARFALKLNPEVFDYLTIDSKRQRRMPTGDDWDHGAPLNLKEARRLTTGIHQGEVEHKYDYSALIAQTDAYGWSSTKQHVSLWMLNPSAEYLIGGPTKVELTGHLDVNPGGLPTLLNMWQGGHYGGRSIDLADHEPWTKVVGPFLIYVNSGPDPEAMWRDACSRAKTERIAWPYSWVADPDYPPAHDRGAVTGRLIVNDPQAPDATAAQAWVGLAAPGVDWQWDGKYYQSWAQADADGRFAIPKVRPGPYTFRAFVDGVLGEFERPGVNVRAGQAQALGALTWAPARFGKQVWEIGIPNRTAAEFRHGDHYWQWGLYLQYPQEFPDDVNYVVGKGDWTRDWNYCQPPRIDPSGKTTPTTWSITFDLKEVPRGPATLRLALCGTRARGRVWASANDQPIGDTGELPEAGVMHRDGIRGAWLERNLTFPARLLKPGTNVIKLRSRGDNWTQGVLYDYLRLEIAD